MKRVLIIDSDGYLAGIYARRFEQGAWHVLVADQIEEAQIMLKKGALDAILIDVQTVEHALEFIKKTRKTDKKVRIFALTTMADREHVKKALHAGADHYLLKGHFVPKELREKVESLVAEA